MVTVNNRPIQFLVEFKSLSRRCNVGGLGSAGGVTLGRQTAVVICGLQQTLLHSLHECQLPTTCEHPVTNAATLRKTASKHQPHCTKYKQGIHRHQTLSRYHNTTSGSRLRFSRPRIAIRPTRPNVTSSIKPEVHNVLQRRQRRTKPQPQGIHTQNFAKIGPAVP